MGNKIIRISLFCAICLNFYSCDEIMGGATGADIFSGSASLGGEDQDDDHDGHRDEDNDHDHNHDHDDNDDGPRPLPTRIGGVDYRALGEGKFLLDGSADNGGNSGHAFRMRFKLPEGKSVSFFFFASRELKGGAKYTFTRRSGVVGLEMNLNDNSHSIELLSLNESEVIDIDFDFHNDHTDAHMLLWERGGEYGDRPGCSDDGSCLYNSEDFSFDEWFGVGRAGGSYWGVEGDSSLILKLEGPSEARSNA